MTIESLLKGLGRGLLQSLRGTEAAPNAAVPVASGLKQEDGRGAAANEIVFLDGLYLVGGYYFTSHEQARIFQERRRAALRPAAPRLPIDTRDTRARVNSEQMAGTRNWSPPPPAPRVATLASPAVDVRWIGESTRLAIGGIQIEAELLYAGKPKGQYEHPSHNSLIDPGLKVASEGDPAGATLNYWPHYAQLDPRARRTYLEWLARGRRDPDIPIGYVFVYFYGLERRLIHDRSTADAPRILAEVEALLDLHGSNHSFARYAGALLQFGSALHSPTDHPLTPDLVRRFQYEMPLDIRVALGRLLAAGTPLNAEQALTWMLALPDTYLRTPATRCFDELRALWGVRFAEAYPLGLKLRTPKTCVTAGYYPASGGYRAEIKLDDVPDIATIQAPVERLRELARACTEELQAYSRLLGKDNKARGTLIAAALLPPELRDGKHGAGFARCAERFATLLEGETVGVTRAGEILALLEMDWPEGETTLPTSQLRQVSGLLDALNLGFEPDRRYGPTAPLASDTPVCLFRVAGAAPVLKDNETYEAARTLVEIGMLAALSDGRAIPIEIQSIADDLEGLPGLLPTEILRLVALARAIACDPPKARAAMKRMTALPAAMRQRVAGSAIAAILADGRVVPGEVKFLESLHKALGLPPEDVYAVLHRGAVEFDAPVSVSDAVPGAGVALPPFQPAKRPHAIDEARLARIRAETSQVSALLSTIFVDEEPVPSKPIAIRDASLFSGLDGAHGDILSLLLKAPMEREAFDSAAARVRLLPSGAIETINDWGFELFGEPILEEDDLIFVASHIIPSLNAMGEAA